MRASEKLTVNEILDGICEDIRRQLTKQDAFGNDSLCYSGAKYVFAIKVDLSSRGDSHVDAKSVGQVGEMPTGEPVEAVEATGGKEVTRKAGWAKAKAKKATESPDGHIA